MDPTDARRLLMEGYTRFVTARPAGDHRTHDRMVEVAEAPHPFAVILGCADSRVPPEIVFDQGFGDLFVVRIAGAVVSDEALASIELAVREMGVPLVVALGHTRCQALHDCMEIVAGAREADGQIGVLVDLLRPAIDAASADGYPAVIRAAVRLAAERLRAAEPVLAPAVRDGTLEVAGWLYDVDGGILEMLT